MPATPSDSSHAQCAHRATRRSPAALLGERAMWATGERLRYAGTSASPNLSQRPASGKSGPPRCDDAPRRSGAQSACRHRAARNPSRDDRPSPQDPQSAPRRPTRSARCAGSAYRAGTRVHRWSADEPIEAGAPGEEGTGPVEHQQMQVDVQIECRPAAPRRVDLAQCEDRRMWECRDQIP